MISLWNLISNKYICSSEVIKLINSAETTTENRNGQLSYFNLSNTPLFLTMLL